MKTDPSKDRRPATKADLAALENRLEEFFISEVCRYFNKPRPLYYPVSDAARMIGITPQGVRKRLRDPNEQWLKGIQSGVNASWQVSVKSLEAWLEFKEGAGKDK